MTEHGEIPYRFERTASAAELHRRHGGLGPGTETGEVESVAGRLMLRRVQGKVAFGTLADSSGRIQLFARVDETPRFDDFCALNLGDWVGVTGGVLTTRRGELSVRVEDWVVLAPARRQFPDKWHGLADVETRYRQRYVDLWAGDDTRHALLLRSAVVSWLRRLLEERGFVEVETPVLHPVPGGALARPFVTHHEALDLDLYLRIAPELYLKRLVVGGFERVFEIGRVFRNEGISPRHNPEFTMLELYQAYADYGDVMVLTEELVARLATELCGGTHLRYGEGELDLAPPWRRATLTEVVAEHTGMELDVNMPVVDLQRAADRLGLATDHRWGAGKLLLEIYEKTTEHRLWEPVFVLDYPTEVSPLARRHRSRPGYVERFEAIAGGRELANAFTELVDPDEQRARFEAQAAERLGGDTEAMVVDDDYLRALEYGLPPTAGLGVGIDRLAMLFADAANIRDVIAFPTLRPEPGE
jgi:lysyl-tRNA synthetase class 2